MATPQPAPPNFLAGQQAGLQGAAASTSGDVNKFFNSFSGGRPDYDALNAAQKDANSALVANYGGVKGGANQFADYTSGLAAAAAGQQAPTMDLGTANAARGQSLQGMAAQQQGLGALQQQAAGQGPGATAAQAGFNVNANTGMLAALQASGGGRGGAGQAMAQQQALASNAAAMNAGAAQAGQQRANYAQQGMGAYQQGAQGLSAGAQTLQNQDFGNSLNQAQIQQQQGQIDVNGAMGYLGLGQQALASQGNADAATYAANVGNTTAANQLATNNTLANTGMALGAVSGAASALGKFANGSGGGA